MSIPALTLPSNQPTARDVGEVMVIQTTEVNIEEARLRLRKMNDGELLRYGQTAKYMCSRPANMGKPPREEFVMQLREARAEWRRRFPKLPLSESV